MRQLRREFNNLPPVDEYNGNNGEQPEVPNWNIQLLVYAGVYCFMFQHAWLILPSFVMLSAILVEAYDIHL